MYRLLTTTLALSIFTFALAGNASAQTIVPCMGVIDQYGTVGAANFQGLCATNPMSHCDNAGRCLIDLVPGIATSPSAACGATVSERRASVGKNCTFQRSDTREIVSGTCKLPPEGSQSGGAVSCQR